MRPAHRARARIHALRPQSRPDLRQDRRLSRGRANGCGFISTTHMPRTPTRSRHTSSYCRVSPAGATCGQQHCKHRHRFGSITEIRGGELHRCKKRFAWYSFYSVQELFAGSAQCAYSGAQIYAAWKRQGGINERKSTHSRIGCGGALLAQPPGGPRGWGRMELGGPGGPGRGGMACMQTVTGAPYSAVEVRTHEQVLGRRQYHPTPGTDQRVSRQPGPGAQGNHRNRTRRATHTRVAIFDPVAGTITELDAKDKIAFTRPAKFPSASATAGHENPATTGSASRMGLSEANVKHETLASQSIHGLMASGTRVTRTIPAGTIGNSQPFRPCTRPGCRTI